ncbi:MAG TPA: dienelactone hydrolase family protein [Prochlorococcus sp.]|nr:dienelactone hydrolase family protein [Prochlorococcus sp.]
MKSEWIVIKEGAVPLRCWWSKPSQDRDEIVEEPNRVALVLPEIFGVNNWVRSVADRLATRGIPALAMPLFSRTAPELELGYSEDNLIEGRRHKDSTSMEQILTDTYTAICWLNKQFDQPQITVVGFCFGGHAALITATMT